MPQPETEARTRRLLRLNALAAGLLSLVAGAAFFFGAFPFHVLIGWLSISSSVFYLLYAAFFDKVCAFCYREAGIALSLYGVLVITAAVYGTGGVLSPFTFLYIAMLVSEAIYGLENPYTMPFSVTCYLAVVAGLYTGVLPNPAPWSAEIYNYPAGVLLIALLAASYIVMTKSMSGAIVRNLREKIVQEEGDKEALLRKFSELNSTSQLGVLAHRIAHDLRGPITCVSGYLEIEAAREMPPEDREALREVTAAVDGMAASLHNITRFGKPGGPSVERIDVAGFLTDLLAIASFAPQARWVRFERNFGGAPGAATMASRADLQQAFFNILKNAVEAVADNPGDKAVELSLSRAGGELRVVISDNGPGVPEDRLEQLLRKSVTTKKDGTGVGLLIARDLLVRNGGELRLANRPGGGFSATLQLRAC